MIAYVIVNQKRNGEKFYYNHRELTHHDAQEDGVLQKASIFKERTQPDHYVNVMNEAADRLVNIHKMPEYADKFYTVEEIEL